MVVKPADRTCCQTRVEESRTLKRMSFFVFTLYVCLWLDLSSLQNCGWWSTRCWRWLWHSGPADWSGAPNKVSGCCCRECFPCICFGPAVFVCEVLPCVCCWPVSCICIFSSSISIRNISTTLHYIHSGRVLLKIIPVTVSLTLPLLLSLLSCFTSVSQNC